MGDAIIALTTNVAIRRNSGKGGFLQFQDEWYDINNDDTPDGSSIEKKKLTADLA